MKSIFRWGYIASAWLFVAGVILQIFLAGLSLFDRASYWDTHIGVGFTLGFVVLPLLIFGLLGRIPRAVAKWLAAVIVVYIVQTMLPGLRLSAPLVAALHPLNAMFLFYLTAAHALKAYRVLRPAAAPRLIAESKEAPEHAHLGAP